MSAPADAVREALAGVACHLPMFAPPDSVPEDDACEITLTWREVHQIKAALEAPLPRSGDRAQAGEGWRTIDSAPMDGTKVDLYGTRNGDPRRFPDAYYAQDTFGGNEIDRWSWHHPRRDIYGEFVYTHWRLPPAPPPTPDASPAEGREDAGLTEAQLSKKMDNFARSLTVLAHQYGLGVEYGVLYEMEPDDFAFSYIVDDAGRLIRDAKSPAPSPAPMAGGETDLLVRAARDIAKAEKPEHSETLRNLLLRLAAALTASRQRWDEAKAALERKTYNHNGHNHVVSYPSKSDAEIAGMVRMLMRGDLDHEAVCVAARDRILHLSQALASLQGSGA